MFSMTVRVVHASETSRMKEKAQEKKGTEEVEETTDTEPSGSSFEILNNETNKELKPNQKQPPQSRQKNTLTIPAQNLNHYRQSG